MVDEIAGADRDCASCRTGTGDAVKDAAVPRGDGERDAGRCGVVDGDASGIVGVASSAEAQIRDVDVIACVAVAIRVGSALDGGNDIGIAAAAGCVEHFVRDERGLGSHAGNHVRLPRHDAGDVRAVAGVIERVGVVVHEVPPSDYFEARPEPCAKGGVRVIDAGIDDGNGYTFAPRAESRPHLVGADEGDIAAVGQRMDRAVGDDPFDVGEGANLRGNVRWDVERDAVEDDEVLASYRRNVDCRLAAPSGVDDCAEVVAESGKRGLVVSDGRFAGADRRDCGRRSDELDDDAVRFFSARRNLDLGAVGSLCPELC